MTFRQLCLFLALCAPVVAAAEPTNRHPGSWYVQGGAYLHYSQSDDYEGPPIFAGIEHLHSQKAVFGLALFQNSFGQFTQFAYIGRLFRPWDNHPNLHIKLTGGIVQGYRDPHHDTLPIRWGDSWGIGVVPTIGYRKDRWGLDVALLKESGLLFLAGWQF